MYMMRDCNCNLYWDRYVKLFDELFYYCYPEWNSITVHGTFLYYITVISLEQQPDYWNGNKSMNEKITEVII